MRLFKFEKEGIYNWIITIAVGLVIIVLMNTCFDYYLDLNDDVLIKDIISGAYAGSPKGHNIQLLWPLSFVLSILYSITDAIPWYGFFLVRLQYGAIGFIAKSCLTFFDRIFEIRLERKNFLRITLKKVLFCIVIEGLLMSLMLEHMVNIQYTITVAMMASASAIVILTLPKADGIVRNLLNSSQAISFVFIAFLLRSEMMLLMLPFVALAILIRFSYEENAFTVKNFLKYASILISMLVLMLAGFFANKLAYSGDKWKEFSNLFDARTELYDYQVIPLYEGNEAFYESIGLGKGEAVLFENYNFGIDEKIDSNIMWKVALYAKSQRSERMSFGQRLLVKLRLYIYEITHGKDSGGSDYPWNYVTLALYLFIFLALWSQRRLVKIWQIILLFCGRSLIWMYILLGDRSPDRITHSLYFIEIVLLLGILLKAWCWEHEDNKIASLRVLSFMLLALLAICIICNDNTNSLLINQRNREEANKKYIDFYEYAMEHQENYYFVDVYSSVAYSERIFKSEAFLDKSNTELMGGWFSKSPIQIEKLLARGYDKASEALLSEGVYYVVRNDIDYSFLEDFYLEQGIDIAITPDKNNSFGDLMIYEIRRK